MNLYKTLKLNKKRRLSYRKSEEYLFFMRHRDILLDNSKFAFLYDSDYEYFQLIRANIVIHALMNMNIINDEIKKLSFLVDKDQRAKFRISINERMSKLPYFAFGKDRIYIPIFSKAINLLYTNSPEEFLKFPYNELSDDFVASMIDPFDTYGPELFNSYFTHLVRIASNGREVAFFHYDTYAIYIVNSQGRLDCEITLFDKYLDKMDTHHMLERIRPVVQSYFDNNRTEFIENLCKNGFISEIMRDSLINKKHDI